MDGWLGGWVDEWMDRWIDGWINGWNDFLKSGCDDCNPSFILSNPTLEAKARKSTNVYCQHGVHSKVPGQSRQQNRALTQRNKKSMCNGDLIVRPALDNYKLEASLNNTERPCLKNKTFFKKKKIGERKEKRKEAKEGKSDPCRNSHTYLQSQEGK